MKNLTTVFLLVIPVVLCYNYEMRSETYFDRIEGHDTQKYVKSDNEDSNFIQEDESSEIFADHRDGKKYRTVIIGNQIWMAENLNYITGYCYQKDESNCEKYGRLYTWKDALKAPPKGWHLPSKEEWETLISYLALKGENPYDQMIMGGSSGLNVLFGGSLNGEYGYNDLDSTAVFWTSSGTQGFAFKCRVNRHNREVKLSQSRIMTQDYYKHYCFSVRCIKD